MDFLFSLIQISLLLLCLVMIGLILLQGGAGDVSSAFGGGGQLDTNLGVGAAAKMAKITGILGVVFFVLILALAIHKNSGDLRKYRIPAAVPAKESATAPTTVTATGASVAATPKIPSTVATAPVLVTTPAPTPAPVNGPVSSPEVASVTSTAPQPMKISASPVEPVPTPVPTVVEPVVAPVPASAAETPISASSGAAP